MKRKRLFFYLFFFLIFAALVSPFFLMLRRSPAFTVADHAFNAFSASTVLFAGLFFLLLLALWILYSKLRSSFFAQNFRETLTQDFLTFLPLLFFSLTPVILRHYIGTADLQVRLKLLALGIGFVFLYLKLIQIRQGNKPQASPWQKLSVWFSALSLKKKLSVLFITAIILFNAGTALITSRGITTAGDEPHYLLMVQSLLQDRDFDLANNYAQQDYSRYMTAETKMKPHAVWGAKPGTLYSSHAPGISILLLPFYAFGSLFQQKWLLFFIRLGMSVFGALFAAQIFLYARSEWQDENLALRLWVLTSFTSPVFFYSIHIYPDVVIALLSLTVFRVFRFSLSLSWPKLVLSSLLLASFIWFHALKYITLSVPLLVYCLWAGMKKFKLGWKLIVFIAVPATAFLLYLNFQHALFGSYSLSAISRAMAVPAGESTGLTRDIVFGIPFRNRAETLAGYFFDQRDGLLLYAPLYFFAFLGAWEMLRRKARGFFLLLFLTGPYVLNYAFLTVRGGYAPQARPLVAVIWAMVIFLGYLLALNKKNIFSYLFNLAAGLSFVFVVLLLKYPLNLYQETTRGITERGGGLFYLLSNMHFRLPDFLPSYIKVENWRWLPNFVWLGLTILFVVAYVAMKKRTLSPKFFTHLLLACVGILVFFVWIVLFPRKVLLDPVRVTLPSGEKVTFYSLSRSARLIESGKFQLRQDNRAYRFNFTTEKPLDELKISFGSTQGDYTCEMKIFDMTFFRGETARQIKNLNLLDPPRYELGKASYYELTLSLGQGEGVETELNPYLFKIDFSP